MSRRSLAIGVVGAILLAALVFYSDQVRRNTFLTGNFLPPVVIGSALLMAILINPLLRIIRLRPLTGAEIALATGLWLFACFPAGRSFSHWFTNFLMLPHHWTRLNPAWAGDPVRLQSSEVHDPQSLRRRLESAATNAPDSWEALVATLVTPSNGGSTISSDPESLTAALNELIDNPSWLRSRPRRPLPRPLPPYARPWWGRSWETLDLPRQQSLARAVLETLFPELEPRRPPILDAVPPGLLADPSPDPRRALDGYLTGLREPGQPFRLREVPWFAWIRTLNFWLPLLFAFVLWTAGLGLILHRQWAHHELLPYPIAEAIRGILPESGHRFGPALRERAFWITCLSVFAIHMVNYFHRWFPEYGIPINLRLDFRPLLELFPVLRRGGAEPLFLPTIYFTAVGFAYYLAADVSFSLGIGSLLYAIAAGTAAGFGVVFSAGGGHLNLDLSSAIYGGAVAGWFLVVVWSGRRYFSEVLTAAVRPSRHPHLAAADRWAARLTLVGLVAFVVQLTVAGIEWPLALLYTLFTLMIFTIIARLLAEGGTIFCHPYGSPCVMLWLFMGTRALGYHQLLLLSLMSTAFIIETRETLLPLAMTAYKAAEDQALPLGRVCAWGSAAAIAGLVIAVVASLYLQYREGAVRVGDPWTVNGIPQMSLNIASRVLADARARGELAGMHADTPLTRWRQLAPRASHLYAFAIAFGLVLMLTWLRRRFSSWPLNPIFLMLGPTYEGRVFAFSFLLGWAVKQVALKYGGARAYQALKAPMLGLVFGEVLATIVPIIIATLYTAITGRPAVTMRVLPG